MTDVIFDTNFDFEAFEGLVKGYADAVREVVSAYECGGAVSIAEHYEREAFQEVSKFVRDFFRAREEEEACNFRREGDK